jgi:hypothetical protein
MFDDHGSWLEMAELEFSFHDAQQHVGGYSEAATFPQPDTLPACAPNSPSTKHHTAVLGEKVKQIQYILLPRVHLSSIPIRLSTLAWRRRTSTRGTWDPRHLLDGGVDAPRGT